MPRLPSVPPAATRLVLAALLAVAAACGPAAPTATPDLRPGSSPVAASPSRSPAPTPTPVPTVPGPSPTAAASVPPQSESEWGHLWDALPPGFPLPPGAAPAEPGEPASAAFDVPATVPETATFMQGALERANFSTLAMSGPFEDGSMVIDSVGPTDDCRVETSIAPAGNLTRLTIRYGAGCPFP